MFGVSPLPATARVLGGAFDAVLTQPPITPEPPIPAALEGLKYGDPGEGIGLIEPPKPDNTGDAQTSYPIDLPPGRLDWQPDLELSYSSRGPNGWLGVGWDLAIPAITVDTRWGVPRYDLNKESETYSFEGEQLSPTAHRPDQLPREAERRFTKRVEGDYPLIIRHGSNPTDYWWEVHDKVGNKYFYGRHPEPDGRVPDAILRDPDTQNAYWWGLVEKQDISFNTVTYFYSLVKDPGVEGGPEGSQLYPSKITYTGSTAGLPRWGAYEVTFTRDRDLPGYTRRKDVAIDARAGALRVTADLLKRIEVRHKLDDRLDGESELVRRYELGYETGPFEKTLLRTIGQGDANEGAPVFATHTLEYWNDVQENGSYEGFEGGQSWSVGDGGDDVDGELGDVEPTALGGVTTSSGDGRIYLGFNPVSPDKLISIGAGLALNGSDSSTEIMLLDLNGDSLPDKVWDGGGSVHYRLNLTRPGAEPAFGPARALPSLPGLPEDSSFGVSVGPEAFVVAAGVMYAHGWTFTTGRSYFSDVNGDGLFDFVDGGTVFFNYLDENKQPTFTTDSTKTAVPITDEDFHPSLLPNDGDLEARARENFPLVDTVRRWIAPWHGAVRVTGPVTLAAGDSPDGVRVALQHNGSERWSETIAPGGTATVTPPDAPIAVSKGDRLYFRVQSRDDGAVDAVNWDPVIAYQNGEDEDFEPQLDANGQDGWKHVASKEFTLGGRTGIFTKMPLDGQVRVRGVVHKTRATSDDVTVHIEHNGVPVGPPPPTLAADFVGHVEVERTFTVAAPVDDDTYDKVALRLAVDSPIDVTALSWTASTTLGSPTGPRMFYVSATRDGQPVPTTDSSGNPSIEIKAPFDIDVYPQSTLDAPQEEWTWTDNDDTPGERRTVTVEGRIAVPGTTDPARFPFEATMTAKGSNRLLGKGKAVISAAPVPSPLGQLPPTVTAEASFEVEVVEDEPYWFDFTTRSPENAPLMSTDIEVNDGDVPFAFHWPRLLAGDEEMEAFPQPYRGWGYAGYNGDGPRADQAIDEAAFILKKSDFPQDESEAPTDFEEKDTDYKNPLKGKSYLYVPDPAQNRWQGPKQAAPTDDQNQTPRPNIRGATFGAAGGFSPSRLGPDSPLHPSGPARTDRAPTMRGRAQQDSFGAQLSAGLGGIGTGVSWGFGESQNHFIDLNGDAYPDIVGSGGPNAGVQYTTEVGGLHPELGSLAEDDIGLSREYQSTLSSSGATPTIKGKIAIKSGGQTAARMSAGVNLGFSGGLGHGETNHTDGFNDALVWQDDDVATDLADLNGDFLPDQIRVDEGGVRVRWNLGYSFTDEFQFPGSHFSQEQSDNKSAGASVGFNLGRFDFAGGVNVQFDEGHTDMAWVDLNGDFLLDQVEGLNSGVPPRGRDGVRVRFNTGAGLGPSVDFGDFRDGEVGRSKAFGVGAGADFTVGIGPLCWPVKLCYIIVNPGGHGERSVTAPQTALIDVDGDFLPDSITSDSHDSMDVNRNRTGRTNLLKSIQRPLGATIDVDYARSGSTVDQPFPIWVLKQVGVFDGHGGDGHGGAGDDTAIVRYDYDENSNVYDFRERETYGFAKISEHQLDGAGNIYRTFERRYRNGNYYERGLLASEALVDGGGRKFEATVNSYSLFDALTGEPVDLGPLPDTTAAVYPALTKVEKQSFDPTTPDNPLVKTAETQTTYDRRGNAIRMVDVGEPGPADDLTAETTFTNCDAHADFPWTQVPQQLRLVNSTGSPLRVRIGDTPCDFAAIVAVDEHLTPGANGARAHTNVDYADPGGQVSRVLGPENVKGEREELLYKYDRRTGLLVEVVDGHGLSTKVTYDDRFGRVASIEEPTGAVTSFTYDSRGRLIEVSSPLVAGTSMITYEYHAEADDPWVLASHYDAANTGDRIRTVRIIDGVGKEIQTKHDATVYADGTARDMMVVSGSTYFDAFGRAIRQYYPITEGLGPQGGETASAGAFNATDDDVEPEVTTYDVMDRVTKVVRPGERETETRYAFESGPFGERMFSEEVTDPEDNVVRTYRDVRGNIVGVERFGPGSGSLFTRYTYDPLQQLVEIQGPASNVTKMTYDLLGRRTSNEAPETGRTDFEYDLASNLVAKVTPNLRADRRRITYDYRFTRLMGIHYPDRADNVSYVYGEAGEGTRAGRIKTVVDATRTQDRAYDAVGNVVETRDVMKVHNLNRSTTPAHTFTTRFARDTWGRILTLTYPDGEVVTNAYDSGGLVRAVSGVKGPHTYRYVDRLEYDKFGFRNVLNYGNGTSHQSTYDAETLWLANQQVRHGDKELQDLTYGYDNVGNPTERVDDIPVPAASEKGGPSHQNFTYDELYRLISANGTYSDGNGMRHEFTQGFTYDGGGKLTRKQQSDTDFTPSGSALPQQATTFDMAYEYEATQPLAPSHIGTRSYSWDANGNNTGWTEDANGQRRTITWDPENRAASIADQGNTTTYRYGDDGTLGIERGPQGEVELVNQWFTALNGGVQWKDIYAGDLRVATKRVKPDGTHEDMQYFLTGDLQGSITLVTDASGGLFEHVEYFPGGEIWVREKSEIYRQPHLYAGMYHEEFRTLYRTDARWYEPREGLLLSPDPLLVREPEVTVTDPRLIADYTYGFDNPVRFVDPTGNKPVPASFKARVLFTVLGADRVDQDEGKPKDKNVKLTTREKVNKWAGRFSAVSDFAQDLGSINFDVDDDGEREIKVFGFSKKRWDKAKQLKAKLKPSNFKWSNIRSKLSSAKLKLRSVATKVSKALKTK